LRATAREKLEIVLSASAFWQARAEGGFGLCPSARRAR